jgi:hypothetical protein
MNSTSLPICPRTIPSSTRGDVDTVTDVLSGV